MTSKVLGFKGEDIFVFEQHGKRWIFVEQTGSKTITGNRACELVPVCLKSESVSIRQLKEAGEYWHKHIDSDKTLSPRDKLNRHWAIEHLLSWAEKEAKKDGM